MEDDGVTAVVVVVVADVSRLSHGCCEWGVAKKAVTSDVAAWFPSEVYKSVKVLLL